MAQPRKRTSHAAVATAWREFYQTPEGKAAVGALMAHCGAYSPIVAADPITAGIEIGKHNVAAWLAEQIGIRPDAFVQERSDIERVFETLTGAL